MASNNFTYSPSTGNGDTSVTVRPSGANSGTADKVTTLTFSDGVTSKSVTLTQHYRPYFNLSSYRFPSSGGTETVTVYSGNDYFFHGKPSWITLRRNGQTVQEDTRITAGEGVVYTITADENDSTNARQSRLTYYLGFYTQSGSEAAGEYFLLQQEGQEPSETVSIPVTVVVNRSTSATFMVTLDLHSLDTEQTSLVLNFPSGTQSWVGTMSGKVSTTGVTQLSMDVTVGKERTDPNTYSNNIALDYGSDSLYETGSLGTTVTFNTTYQSGEGMTIEIDIVS